MNAWAEALPPGTKVRRTQLAATGAGAALSEHVYVLVSYDPAPEVVRRCTACGRPEPDDSVRDCPRCGNLVLGE